MKKNKIIILLSILLIFLSISSTSAIDNNTEINLENNNIKDSTPTVLSSLETMINTAEENQTIELTGQYIPDSNEYKPIIINKNITITGKNITIINGMGNNNLFLINSTVEFKNIIFTNTTSFIINNHRTAILKNCTFTDLWENTIKNTGNMKIINTTFQNIKSIHTHPHINLPENYYNNTGVIYNTGTLTIKNTRFKNINLPNNITYNSNQTIQEDIIYNLNRTIIDNSNFTNITGRIINNTGKLKVTNTRFTDTTSYGSTININTQTKEYTQTSTNSPDGLIIYNANELYYENNTVDNVQIIWSNLYIRNENNGGGIYNLGNATIINSKFNKILSRYYYYDTVQDEGQYSIINGGAITNYGNLTIKNTIINDTHAKNGAGIYNNGNTTAENITVSYSGADYGMGIYNSGNLTLEKSVFDKNRHDIYYTWNGGVIYNEKNANISSITIKNTIIEYISDWPFIFTGVIINNGNMNLTKSIFNNNTPKEGYYFVTGSYNIYNTGTLNATYNFFINSAINGTGRYLNEVDPYVYAMNDNGKIYMNYNYFDTNTDPYKTYTNFMINQYFIFDIEPEYIGLKIGEKANITATLKLDNGKYYNHYKLLPPINITFSINDNKNITVPLINGMATIEFNQTPVKGTNTIKAYLSNYIKEMQVDVGKEACEMTVEADDIIYKENAIFNMTITGNYTHQPHGNITVYIDNKKYTTTILDNHAQLTVSDLIPKTYLLKFVYEGDDDYFKSIHYQNFTVHKKPTNMTITIPEVYYGETGIATVTLTPNGVSSQAYMYINGVRKTIYLKDTTNINLKNYADGEYNITVVLWENSYYESSNASAVFKVLKYPTSVQIGCDDINIGETATLNITLEPDGEVAGESLLIINNYTQKIFLKNGENLITLENLTGGSYIITVVFPGDKKYASSNDTIRLNVKKHNTTIQAQIHENTITITSPDNITGVIGIYINDEVIKTNITNGKTTYNYQFHNTINYIYILFEGNNYYNYTTTNLTYEYLPLINLTGYDNTTYKELIYHVVLSDNLGNGLNNRTITVSVNGKTYNTTTDMYGLAKLPLPLPIGEYKITSSYKNITITNTLRVIEDAVITSNNIKAYSNDSFTFNVTLKRHNDTPVTNTKVTVKINNITYTNITNSNGRVIFKLMLSKGNYTIKTTYNTLTVTNNVSVVDYEVLFGWDVRGYENTQIQYQVTLSDTDKKPLPNQKITFKLNNNTYSNKTDGNGLAIVNLKLGIGNYTIKAFWNNITTHNKITIIEDALLTANNIKAYANREFTYTITLKNHFGESLPNREVLINSTKYTTNSNGQASATLKLPAGNYTITTTYKNQIITNTLWIIEDAYLTGQNIRAYAYTTFEYQVTLKDNDNNPLPEREITYTLNNKTYKSTTDSNGMAVLSLSMAEGNYSITADYNGITLTNLFVILPDYVITGRDVVMYYHDGTRFIAQLTDSRYTPIANKTINITVNGITYSKTTNGNGFTSVSLNLNSGKYQVQTSYYNQSVTNLVTIKTTVTGSDITKMYRNATQYAATFYNTKGELLTNRQVSFNINGVYYTRNTNGNGVARLNINLIPGTYTITAINTLSSEMHTNTVKVLSTIVNNNDLVKYYRNASSYSVQILDDYGSAAKAGEVVTFNINGVFYTKTTNSNGIAKLNINLQPGNYTITADYNGCRVSNHIEVLPVLFANDLVKNASSSQPFQVILYNGNGRPLPNTEISFNFNGNTFTRTTNAIGIATIKVDLPTGKYLITSSYNDSSITNTITIT